MTWHRMLYSCTHMVTVGIEGLTSLMLTVFWQKYLVNWVVEGQLVHRWRKRTSRHKLPFVRISDELHRRTSWPPPSQLGSSLVDIMRLENSFQAEQSEEALLPKTTPADSLNRDANARPQTELVTMNDVILKSESCFNPKDNDNKPIGLTTLSGVDSDQPRPFDGTIL